MTLAACTGFGLALAVHADDGFGPVAGPAAAQSFKLGSLQKPDWTMGFDSDAAVAKKTRDGTLARLAKTHELVFSPHFPFPGVGHIVADGAAYRWAPELP
jgi:hypothetical protein